MTAMADLAAVFHWQPSEMQELTVEDLLDYWQHARARSGSPGG